MQRSHSKSEAVLGPGPIAPYSKKGLSPTMTQNRLLKNEISENLPTLGRNIFKIF